MLTTYAAVAAFIQEFEACVLPRSRWTHQAHLVAGLWYLSRHPPPEALDEIRERIRRHNVAAGTANTDSGGYHETVTRLYMTAIAAHVAQHEALPFDAVLAALLASPLGDSKWPLTYYTRERLFSVAARRAWVEPDLRPIEGSAAMIRPDESQPPVPDSVERSNGWEAIAPRFIDARQHSRIGVQAVLNWAAALPPRCNVLDLGCGFGVPLAAALIDRGFKVHGIDASPTLVEEFRRRFPGSPVRCETVEGADFSAMTFDGVLAVGLMFLLPPQSQRLLITKVAQVLKTGGSFLFTAPSQDCSWQDILTLRESVSLGREAYLTVGGENDLHLVAEFADEGENQHFVFVKGATAPLASDTERRNSA